MNTLFKISKKQIFPISLIFILAISRLIPHPPNFTPIIAVAIMSSYFFKNIYFSFFILLISMFLSDIFIGFYSNMIFVYFSLLLITYVFFQINEKINSKSLIIFGFFGSLIFYLVSNFGVWALSGMYQKNFAGLVECYILAIPFFKNTLFSTIIFSYSAYLANKYLNKSFFQSGNN